MVRVGERRGSKSIRLYICLAPTAREQRNGSATGPYGPYVDEVAERDGKSADRDRSTCEVERTTVVVVEEGRRGVVAEVRVAEAVASREVVVVRPRPTAERRVDSAQQTGLGRLVARPVDRRQLSHCTQTRLFTVVSHLATLSRNFDNQVRCRPQFGRRAFSVGGPDVWNSLPTDIRLIDSQPSFRRALKTYLFNIAFN